MNWWSITTCFLSLAGKMIPPFGFPVIQAEDRGVLWSVKQKYLKSPSSSKERKQVWTDFYPEGRFNPVKPQGDHVVPALYAVSTRVVFFPLQSFIVSEGQDVQCEWMMDEAATPSRFKLTVLTLLMVLIGFLVQYVVQTHKPISNTWSDHSNFVSLHVLWSPKTRPYGDYKLLRGVSFTFEWFY